MPWTTGSASDERLEDADLIDRSALRVREHGASGPPVVLLHGGPGAAGYMAPVARELADAFRVLEPLQRGASNVPLTVARHVADLHDVIASRWPEARPAIAGHSWGAMLALAYAAAHPATASSLVLIGCGTFDAASRESLRERRDRRMDASLRRRMARLPLEFPDPDDRLRAMGAMMLPAYSCDPVSADLETLECDARAHHESWEDMLRLQEEGVYPAAFSAVKAPVLMLHGAEDPHPGGLIRAGLAPHLPQMEYRLLERCGHYPWMERAARAEFFVILRRWLTTTADPGPAGRAGGESEPPRHR